MRRRHFLLITGAAALTPAASAPAATVLYGDHAVSLDKVRPDPKDLWVHAADLPRINGFEVLRRLLRKGCVVFRQRGSHAAVQCGRCRTEVPLHRFDLSKGLIAAIRRQVRNCIGDDW